MISAVSLRRLILVLPILAGFLFVSSGGATGALSLPAAGQSLIAPDRSFMVRPSTRKSAGLPPVRVDSHATGAAKRRFVRAANAVCAATLVRVKRIPRMSPEAMTQRYQRELERTIGSIDRLSPPRGDQLAVRQVLAEFRRFSQAIGYLITVKGENSLGVVAAIAVTGKRARRAATLYGLTS
jgi:hypothetical protein